MRDRRLLLAVLVAVAVVAFVVALGVLQPPRKGAVISDRLGPEQGESVPAYLDRAHASLTGPDDPRYALVSFATGLTPSAAAGFAAGVRVSQVIFHVSIPQVQTAITFVDVPAGDAAVSNSSGVAAGRVLADVVVQDSRAGQVATVSATRLAAGCACVAALTVRATTAQLETLARQSGVRAVEALAPDAVFGRFAVSPLLPEQLDVVSPAADDGPVPEN